MLPWAMRRRSASGVWSTSCTWSAARTIASGMISRCSTPVIRSITSLSDSRCWMLTVEMTSMPASSSSSTSCQRFSCRAPGHVGVGQLVDQARPAAPGRGSRRRPSPRARCRGRSPASPGHDLEVADLVVVVLARPCVSTMPTTTSVPRSRATLPLLQHRVRLADARAPHPDRCGADLGPRRPA